MHCHYQVFFDEDKIPREWWVMKVTISYFNGTTTTRIAAGPFKTYEEALIKQDELFDGEQNGA